MHIGGSVEVCLGVLSAGFEQCNNVTKSNLEVGSVCLGNCTDSTYLAIC